MQRINDFPHRLKKILNWTSSSEFNKHIAILEDKNSNAYRAVIFVDEKGIWLQLLYNSIDAIVSKKLETEKSKFLIDFANVNDARLSKDSERYSNLKDFRSNFGYHCRLDLSNDNCLDVYCSNENSQILRHIIASYFESRIRRSIQIGTVIMNSDYDLGTEYYNTTISSLSRPLVSADLIAILEEFSKEIQLDIELKAISFQSRDIILILQNILLTVLGASFKSSENRQFYQDTGKTPHPIIELSIVNCEHLKFQNENERNNFKLNKILLRRLKIIQSSLKTLYSLLVNSDSLQGRFGCLSGPYPLVIQSWLDLLVPDLYDKICCSTTTSTIMTTAATTTATNKFAIPPTIQINNDIERSLFSSTRFHHHDDKDKVNKTKLHSLAMSVSEMVFLPLRERVSSQFIHLSDSSYTSRDTAHNTLLSVRQSIRDLQSLCLCAFAQMIVIGQPPNPATTTTSFPVLTLPPLGSLIIRQPYCLLLMEDLVLRLYYLLECMVIGNDHTTTTTTTTTTVGTLGGKNQRVAPPTDANNNNNNISNYSDQYDFKMTEQDHPFAVASEKSALKREKSPVGTNSLSQSRVSFDLTMRDKKEEEEDEEEDDDNNNNSISHYSSNQHLSSTTSFNYQPSTHSNTTTSSSSFSSYYTTTSYPVLQRRDALIPPTTSPQKTQKKGNRNSNIGNRSIHKANNSNITDNNKNNNNNNNNNNESNDNDEDDAEGFHQSQYENREVLLFKLAWLLKSLALDSYEMRSLLVQDLEEYWPGIMATISLICPRPKSTLIPIPSSSSSASDFKHEVTKKATAISRTGLRKNTKSKSDESTVTAVVTNPNLSLTVLTAKDFGAPRYGLNDSSWYLIVQTRLHLEDLLRILHLNPSLLDPVQSAPIITIREKQKLQQSTTATTTRRSTPRVIGLSTSSEISERRFTSSGMETNDESTTINTSNNIGIDAPKRSTSPVFGRKK